MNNFFHHNGSIDLGGSTQWGEETREVLGISNDEDGNDLSQSAPTQENREHRPVPKLDFLDSIGDHLRPGGQLPTSKDIMILKVRVYNAQYKSRDLLVRAIRQAEECEWFGNNPGGVPDYVYLSCTEV